MPEEARQGALFDAVSSLPTRLVASGKSVVVAQSNPRPDVVIPRHFARLAKNGQAVPESYTYDLAFFEEQTAFSRRLFETVADDFAGDEVALAYPESVLCDEGGCAVVQDHMLMFSDGNHLSVQGAKLVSPIIASSVLELQ